MDINKKDIIAFNQRFDRGYFDNESSLDFALSFFKKDINWTKKISYLLRAILIDHVFEEGNKRTAAAVLLYYIEYKGYKIQERIVVNIIKRIVLYNITSIKKIKMMIEDGISKQD
jgi:hypothetical protein